MLRYSTILGNCDKSINISCATNFPKINTTLIRFLSKKVCLIYISIFFEPFYTLPFFKKMGVLLNITWGSYPSIEFSTLFLTASLSECTKTTDDFSKKADECLQLKTDESCACWNMTFREAFKQMKFYRDLYYIF